MQMAEDLEDGFGVDEEGFGMDEDDAEPLFGDDLDDPPPLAPPMPSLSQIQSNHTVREGGREGGTTVLPVCCKGGVELPLCCLFVAAPWTLAWDWRCRGWDTYCSSGWEPGPTSEEEEASTHFDHR